jgi:hypothetical protein
MAEDISNNVRVDLQEIFDSCEQQTAYHSRMVNNNEENQRIIISEDDYGLIWPWANDAAVLLADACNYITNTTQSGLDAISSPYIDADPEADPPIEGTVNTFDAEDHLDLTQAQKQTGELLSKKAMDTLIFNVDQMEGMTPLKYTVTQSQIRAAIIEYVLFKWYELNRITDSMSLKWQQFEYWKGHLMTNSLNNQKTFKVRKPYRLF